ncbi:proprotein convertase P-domain-containing protein [Montanilutibacter psychrotolerans]|nr:proprotein convertase P-domain-containing protein [Lysobacter psychrotolerans]
MGQVDSPIVVSGRTGNVTASAVVTLNVTHTYRGDLKIDLVAPDGSLYPIKSSSDSDSADNVIGSTKLNLTSEALNGTWKLRVADGAAGDTGKLNSWSIKF